VPENKLKKATTTDINKNNGADYADLRRQIMDHSSLSRLISPYLVQDDPES